MKRLIVTLVVVLLLCTQAYAGDFTTWIWGSEAISARLGYLTNEDKNTEVGLSVSFWEDDKEPQVIGLYFLRYLPDVLQVPNPIVLDWLPEILNGSPYFGAKLERNLNLNTTALSPVAGIALEKIFFIEYQFKTFQEQSTGQDVSIGLRWEF